MYTVIYGKDDDRIRELIITLKPNSDALIILTLDNKQDWCKLLIGVPVACCIGISLETLQKYGAISLVDFL